MDFIVDNYIWFIVGGVILIMTLIGYIADKTQFVENQKTKDREKKANQEKRKKEKKSKEQEIFEKEIHNGKNLVLEESPVDYPVEIEENTDIPPVDTSFEEQMNPIDEGLTFEDPLLETPVETAEEPASLTSQAEEPIQTSTENTDLSDINSDIMKPLEDGVLHLDHYVDEDKKVETPIITPSIEETAPLVEEPTSPIQVPNESENITPSEESPFTDTSDDDVWKF